MLLSEDGGLPGRRRGRGGGGGGGGRRGGGGGGPHLGRGRRRRGWRRALAGARRRRGPGGGAVAARGRAALDVRDRLGRLHVGRREAGEDAQQRLGLVLLRLVVAVVRHAALVDALVLPPHAREPQPVRDVVALDADRLQESAPPGAASAAAAGPAAFPFFPFPSLPQRRPALPGAAPAELAPAPGTRLLLSRTPRLGQFPPPAERTGRLSPAPRGYGPQGAIQNEPLPRHHAPPRPPVPLPGVVSPLSPCPVPHGAPAALPGAGQAPTRPNPTLGESPAPRGWPRARCRGPSPAGCSAAQRGPRRAGAEAVPGPHRRERGSFLAGQGEKGVATGDRGLQRAGKKNNLLSWSGPQSFSNVAKEGL